jgi:hypothetical protein
MRHEVHLVRRGLEALVLALPLLVAAGAIVAGGRGALSVLLGAGIIAANQVLAAASTGWARTLGFGPLAVAFGMYWVRMLGVVAVFAAVASIGWVHRPLVAIAFCAALVVTLGAECWSYARKSYVPSWRLTT